MSNLLIILLSLMVLGSFGCAILVGDSPKYLYSRYGWFIFKIYSIIFILSVPLFIFICVL